MSADPHAKLLPIDTAMYVRMHEADLFLDRRVELIDGQLIEMGPAGDPHFWATAELGRHFTLALGALDEYRVAQQGGFAAAATSLPDPDLVVIHLDHGRHVAPGRDDSGPVFVAEVSATSLLWDLGRKRLLYARAGIPEYWVLDLEGERLVVHRDPVDGDYATVTNHRRGEPVAPQDLPFVTAFDIAAAVDAVP
ncbi:hypothetical protein DSM112329_00055 [Paraconexibacter sp. AEG42_29]|uniref:Putative restriction endonuclease domain-containing protein n=1 Tax=Paraconexibacter sp. AEG42_29 TaxID=2997339 RepID=A0AAU7ANM8_9ACTN